jgi:hypothetical protein
VPSGAVDAPVDAASIEKWARNGWVDLRLANCAIWKRPLPQDPARLRTIPADETSSRYVRNRRYWDDGERIQPGKVVGWILSVEEGGNRLKR